MSKEWTIVALQDDTLNLPRDVVRFLDHDDTAAANIASPPSESDDSIARTITNDAVVTRKRKRRPRLALDFKRLRWQDALKLRQMESQNRPVYFCPNVEEQTIWMQPFFGNNTEFLRDEAPPAYLTSDTFGWLWDEARQSFFRQTAWMQSNSGASAFRLDSPYGIASRPSLHDFTNRATKPLPDSTTTGWAVVTGAGTVAYDNEVRLPDAGDPDASSTSGGVTVISADGATAPSFAVEHTASSLTADAQICASILVRAVEGTWTATLHDAAGANIDAAAFSGDRGWTLIRLQGAQSAAGTTCSVRLSSTAGDNREMTIQAGTVFLSNMPSAVASTTDWPFPDFVEVEQDQNLYQQSEGPTVAAGFTVSVIVQHQSGEYPIFILGSGSDALVVDSSSTNTAITVTGVTISRTFAQAGIEVGDYYMVTVVNDSTGLFVYLNGVDAGSATGNPMPVQQMNNTKRVGYLGAPLEWSEMGGFNLFRIDNTPWSAAKVLRHYETYLAPSGVAYVAPHIGWTFHIASLDYEPMNIDDSRLLVKGQIVLEGLTASPKFRTLHPNLNDNTDG